jgi:hypothetical protein
LTDESLIREVDEEVRLEQYQQLWKRYGNVIIAVTVIIVASVAGFKAWEYYDTRRSEAAASQYFAALNLATQGKSDEAARVLDALAGGSHHGYAVLARLQRAADLAKAGKADEAVRAYDVIAGESSVEPAIRDMARIRAAYLLIDTASPDELAKRVEPLNVAGNPWRNPAREVIGLASYRARDFLAADRLMNEILVDPESTEAQRRRAQLMISLLAPRLDKPVAAVQ